MLDYKRIKRELDKKFEKALEGLPYDMKNDFWSIAVADRDKTISKYRMEDAKANNIRRELFARILTKDAKVLDAGCGDGRQLKWLAENFPGLSLRLFGLDLSEVLLKRAKERLKFYPFLTITNNSIDSIPYRDSSFDIVVCFSVLQYYSLDPIKALNEMERVLKEWGFLVIYKAKPKHLDPFLIPDTVFAINKLVRSKKRNVSNKEGIFEPKNSENIERFINKYLQTSNLQFVYRKAIISSFKWSFYWRVFPQIIPILARFNCWLNKLPLNYYKDSEIIIFRKLHRK